MILNKGLYHRWSYHITPHRWWDSIIYPHHLPIVRDLACTVQYCDVIPMRLADVFKIATTPMQRELLWYSQTIQTAELHSSWLHGCNFRSHEAVLTGCEKRPNKHHNNSKLAWTRIHYQLSIKRKTKPPKSVFDLNIRCSKSSSRIACITWHWLAFSTSRPRGRKKKRKFSCAVWGLRRSSALARAAECGLL